MREFFGEHQEIIDAEGMIDNIFPEFFKQLPSEYEYLNSQQYKNVRISIGDTYLDITTKLGDAIGGINFRRVGNVYYIDNLSIEEEFLSKKYASLLIELLNYFLSQQKCIGILDDQHYFRQKNTTNQNRRGNLYEKHNWILNADTKLFEFVPT